METVQLNVTKRDPNVKAKDYRKQGKITAEYYGKGVENQSFMIDYQSFRKAYAKAGRSTVLDLMIDGSDKPIHALVHEVDYDPVSDMFMHIDFVHVDLNKEVETKIPLVFVGVPPAVRDLHGTLTMAVQAIAVRCLAKDLVHSIEVDVSPLALFNDVIRVKDLKVPAGMKIMDDLELTVATVAPPKEEKEEAPVVAPADIPVINEKKVEGAEGEGEEGAGAGKKKE